MGWYPVSFTIIVNKDVWMCTPGRCSWALFKNCLRPLRFSLYYWCLKSFLFWRLSISYRSCFFHSCIFHRCYLLLLFPLLHFPLPHFQRPRWDRSQLNKMRTRIKQWSFYLLSNTRLNTVFGGENIQFIFGVIDRQSASINLYIRLPQCIS